MEFTQLDFHVIVPSITTYIWPSLVPRSPLKFYLEEVQSIQVTTNSVSNFHSTRMGLLRSYSKFLKGLQFQTSNDGNLLLSTCACCAEILSWKLEPDYNAGTNRVNSLGPIADISVMRLLASWCHFRQCPWDLVSAWAERAGQGRWVGAPEGCKQHGCIWARL